MSNIAISLDLQGDDVTYEELRRFVEATSDYEPDDEVYLEKNMNFETIGFKAQV